MIGNRCNIIEIRPCVRAGLFENETRTLSSSSSYTQLLQCSGVTMMRYNIIGIHMYFKLERGIIWGQLRGVCS